MTHRDIGTGPSPTLQARQDVAGPRREVRGAAVVLGVSDRGRSGRVRNDPNDPNHIFGHQPVTEMDGSTTTYVWDLVKS